MPRYDRHSDFGDSPVRPQRDQSPSGSVIIKAAEALRDAELEAARPEPTEPQRPAKSADLDHMSIDELRELAKEMDIPNRAQITEQDELIAAIRERM
jgi:hypothetical protein